MPYPMTQVELTPHASRQSMPSTHVLAISLGFLPPRSPPPEFGIVAPIPSLVHVHVLSYVSPSTCVMLALVRAHLTDLAGFAQSMGKYFA